MTWWIVLIWIWSVFAVGQWGLSLGSQHGDGSLKKLYYRLDDDAFQTAIVRGFVLSLFAWPYLTYRGLRDLLREEERNG